MIGFSLLCSFCQDLCTGPPLEFSQHSLLLDENGIQNDVFVNHLLSLINGVDGHYLNTFDYERIKHKKWLAVSYIILVEICLKKLIHCKVFFFFF